MKNSIKLLAAVNSAMLIASTLSGAVTAFTDGGDASGLLIDVTVDGTTYNGADLVSGSLTDVTQDSARLIYGDGSIPATGSRSTMIEDLNLQTGLINISSMDFTFDSPIENISGIDFLIWDWGSYGSDSFDLTINGTTFTGLTESNLPTGGSALANDPGTRFNAQLTDAGSAVNSLADLESASLTGNSNSLAWTGVIGIDLDAFGVSSGGSVGSFSITNASGFDPVLVGGLAAVPEPSTYALLGGLMALGMVVLRRRVRR